jgi:hypothetical protein
MDGTPKLADEGFTRPWPEKMRMSDDVKARVDALEGRIGLGPATGVEATPEPT